MHLNHCALVSSFLFIPIVLADNHNPEKYRPRRLLNKQNINAASDDVPWAGAYLPGSDLGVYISTTGAFTVPLAWGASGKTGFSISVGIGGVGSTSLCQDGSVRFLASVDVYLIDHLVSYAAELQWGNQTRQSSDTNITIDLGDFIRLTVNVDSPTTGSALLENLSKKQSWNESFAQGSVVCQKSAEWVVEAFPGYSTDMPVPKFGGVAFSNATVKTTYGESAPAWSGGATVVNMEFNDTTFSACASDANTVFVSREMPEEDLVGLPDSNSE